MTFIWDKLAVGNIALASIFIILVYGLLFFSYAKIINRRIAFFFLGASCLTFVLGFLFDIVALLIIGAAATIICTVISMYINIGDLRKFLANPFKITSAKNVNFGVERIYDRQEVYEKIDAAVKKLSMSKTGAIITFEKNTSLKDIIKNGTPINAPVSEELLETIFFPGTRLHDGAVIIHGNEIIAASVFFTPTTKPFAGKYGSRHRAAIGISEVCDAVTVVVSEETGRISFAVNGELEIVSPDNFLRSLENHLDFNEEE